ncbi:MAG TPA: phosphomethylpyrimidine synthase, partial [Firmicutes bacterium]|nr:phosphomethylpyrimidine synthase [Bacillota bacterium]
MTQLESALKGETTEQMAKVAEDEGMDIDVLRKAVAEGRVVIPHNPRH